MAIFPELLVVGVCLILCLEKQSGAMNLGSHLCAVIELNL